MCRGSKSSHLPTMYRKTKIDYMTDKELWAHVCIAVAGSANVQNINSPAKWADEAVKQYRERFPEPAKQAEPKPELRPRNTTWNYPLWEHMANEHKLILLESEIQDIVSKSDQCRREAAVHPPEPIGHWRSDVRDILKPAPLVHFDRENFSDYTPCGINLGSQNYTYSRDWACVTCPECFKYRASTDPWPTNTVCSKASETGPCVLLKGHDGRCDFDQSMSIEPGVPGVLSSKPSTSPVIHMEHDDTDTMCGTSGISSKDRSEVTCSHCIGLFDIPF